MGFRVGEIEAYPFFFSPIYFQSAFADNGGLFEIISYRAKGERRQEVGGTDIEVRTITAYCGFLLLAAAFEIHVE